MRRRFEFQVMPQLLNYLGTEPDDPVAPDFGTLAVYRREPPAALVDDRVGH